MKALGIDVGSLNVKAVILDGSGSLASVLLPAGEGAEATAKAAMEEVIKKAGLKLRWLVYRGYRSRRQSGYLQPAAESHHHLSGAGSTSSFSLLPAW